MFGYLKSAVTALAAERDEITDFRRDCDYVRRFFDSAIMDPDAMAPQLADLAPILQRLTTTIQHERQAAETSSGSRRCFEILFDPSAGFMLTVCQHAKINQPDGLRAVLLDFLTALVHCAEARPGELLLMELVREPLLDMLQRTAATLAPRADTAKQQQVEPPSLAAERLRVVQLLAYVAEGLAAQYPLLQPVAPGSAQLWAAASGRDGARGGGGAAPEGINVDVLLDALLRFCGGNGMRQYAPEASELVARAVLCLSLVWDDRCTPCVESRAAQFFTAFVSHMCSAYTSMCRLQQNSDFNSQALVCTSMTRFFDDVFTLAPHLASATGLRALITDQFLTAVAVPGVSAPNDRGATTAMLCLSNMVRCCSGSTLPCIVTEAILGSGFSAIAARAADIAPSVASAAWDLLLALLETAPRPCCDFFAHSLSAPTDAWPIPTVAAADAAWFPAVLTATALGDLQQDAEAEAQQRVIRAASAGAGEPKNALGVVGEGAGDGATTCSARLGRALLAGFSNFSAHSVQYCSLMTGVVLALLALPDERVRHWLVGPQGMLGVLMAPVKAHIEGRLQRGAPALRDAAATALRAGSVAAANAYIDAGVAAESQAFLRTLLVLAAFRLELLQQLRCVDIARELQGLESTP